MTGERFVLWWVGRYTRGLPEAAAATRREELVSDVWEHRSALGATPSAQLVLLSRCLRGIPADLSWRHAQRRVARRLPTAASAGRAVGWTIGGLGYASLLAGHAWIAAGIVRLNPEAQSWDQDDLVAAASISGTLLVAFVVGALLLRRRPLVGAVLVAAGSFATLLAYWWMIPVTGPCGIAATAAAVILASRRRKTQLLAASVEHRRGG